MIHILSIVVLLLYLVSMTVWLWRSLVQGEFRSFVPAWILLPGIVVHGFLLLHILVTPRYPLLPWYPFSLSLVSFVLAIGAFLLSRRRRFEALGVFLSPLIVVLFGLSSAMFHAEKIPNDFFQSSPSVWFHVVLALFGDAAFAMAAVTGMTFLLQDRLLRRKQRFELRMRLPALETLDWLMNASIATGLILMTIAVTSGYISAAILKIDVSGMDPRLLMSTGILLFYGALLGAKLSAHLRSRAAAWGSILGFAILVLTSFGVNIVGDSFHVY